MKISRAVAWRRILRTLRRSGVTSRKAILHVHKAVVQAIPTSQTFGTQVLKLASSQVGVKETPVNDVKYNTWYYGKRVNGTAYPWCAVFVSWCLSQKGRAFREAYVPDIVNKAHARQEGLSVVGFARVAGLLKAGFPVLACYDWPGESPGLADHVEFVEKVLGSSSFRAIGGNTSPPGGSGSASNGGEVCRNIRSTSSVLAFVKVA